MNLELVEKVARALPVKESATYRDLAQAAIAAVGAYLAEELRNEAQRRADTVTLTKADRDALLASAEVWTRAGEFVSWLTQERNEKEEDQ